MRKREGKRWKGYRIFLLVSLAAGCAALFLNLFAYYYNRIPNELRISTGEQELFLQNYPMTAQISRSLAEGEEDAQGEQESIQVNFLSPVTVTASEPSRYLMKVKLFGVIPLKEVNLEVVSEKQLIPAGLPVGIYLKTEGVMVIEVGGFTGENGMETAPAKGLLQAGDYILSVNGTDIQHKSELVSLVEDCEGKSVSLTVLRDGNTLTVSILPVKNTAGKYRLGVWVRDSAQGVGMLTYVDGDGNFGALGHGINDVDTSMTMDLKSGTLYKTDIIAIKKGEKGEPGEMTGMIIYTDQNILGQITDNTAKGIFGTCNEQILEALEGPALPIGYKQEVVIGPAQIYCAVDGKPAYYNIEIKECNYDKSNVNKGIVLQVTDPELIAKTGGIVQGMSGAPILQDGKIIGAVTHVLVDDPTKGYGIFIEEMLEK